MIEVAPQVAYGLSGLDNGKGKMPQFSLYIMKQISGPLILLTFCFSGVIWLTQSLRFVDLILNKGLSLGLFLYMTVLLLPSLLATILPIALFIAILYAYYHLISDREILVLKTRHLNDFVTTWVQFFIIVHMDNN